MAITDTTGTVTPVVDYEPQLVVTVDRAPRISSHRPTLHTDVRRPVHPPAGAPVLDVSPRYRSATAFADAALRTILEVIDLRRPATQLRPLMGTGLTDSVVAFTRATRHRPAAAVLKRVRLQPCGADEHAFEVTAAYARHPRLHAIAGRVEHVTTLQGRRWQIVALHIG